MCSPPSVSTSLREFPSPARLLNPPHGLSLLPRNFPSNCRVPLTQSRVSPRFRTHSIQQPGAPLAQSRAYPRLRTLSAPQPGASPSTTSPSRSIEGVSEVENPLLLRYHEHFLQPGALLLRYQERTIELPPHIIKLPPACLP